MSRNNITTLATGVTQSLSHLKTLLLAENMMESSSFSHHDLQHLSYLGTMKGSYDGGWKYNNKHGVKKDTNHKYSEKWIGGTVCITVQIFYQNKLI